MPLARIYGLQLGRDATHPPDASRDRVIHGAAIHIVAIQRYTYQELWADRSSTHAKSPRQGPRARARTPFPTDNRRAENWLFTNVTK